jgi:phosphatidate cytidylyltransferase
VLKARILTALVAGALVLLIGLLLPPWVAVTALTLFVIAGAWEWSSFLRLPSASWRWGYVVVIAALLPLTWQLTVQPGARVLLLGVAVAWWVVALAWMIIAPRRVNTATAALAGVLALVPAWVALVYLAVDVEYGAQWMLFALALPWVADIGAYAVGRLAGRRPLAPQVSPKKTWEGVLGGLAAGGVFAIWGATWFGVPLQWFVPLCLVAVVFSIVGDLTESLLKRFAGIKDSGRLFPGHGGVMDRLDSVTAASPVFLLGLALLGGGFE